MAIDPAPTEDRFRSLADEAPVMIFLADADPVTSRTFFNAGWTDFVGRSESDLARDGWLTDVHQADREALRNDLLAAAAQRVPYTAEYRMRRSDGTMRWVVERAGPRASGGYAGTAADITDGRAAREALAASERRFRALVEQSNDVVLLVEGSGSVRYASPSAERVLGWEIVPTRIALDGLVHDDDRERFVEAWSRALAEPGLAPMHAARIRDGYGQWRNVEVIFNNVTDDPDVGGVVVTLRDITERLQSRETIDRLRAALSSVKDEERRDLAMALHDDTIQSILAAQWTLSSLERVVEQGSAAATQLEDVGAILDSAASSARAVLADLRVPDFAEVELLDTLTELCVNHERAGGPPAEISYELGEDLGADMAAIVHRVVREAFINVRKHAQAQRVRATIRVDTDLRQLVVEIVDDGRGIETGIVERRAREGHYGIVSLTEQVARFGGTVVLQNGTPTGAVLRAVWPWSGRDDTQR